MMYKPEDKPHSSFDSLSSLYNDNSISPSAIPLSSTIQTTTITDLAREYDQGVE